VAVYPAGVLSTADAGDIALPLARSANDSAKTAEHLAAWLAAPHSPMPNLNLSHDEIDDLIAPIESLKTE
jgi:hypothetical protein